MSRSDVKYNDSSNQDGAYGYSYGSSSSRAQLPADSFLREVRDSSLAKYAAENLRPSGDYNTLLGKGMDAIARFLMENARFTVKEVVKGGSAGKGTTIEGKSDIDIVVFLNDFKTQADVNSGIASTLESLESELRRFGTRGAHKVTVTGHTRFCVKLELTPAGMAQSVDIDLLPAYDNLGNLGKNGTYQAMMRDERNRQFYSSSLTPLQIDFIKTRPSALKDLIRLVKFWRKTHFDERSAMKRSLPTSYPLELIVVHCWEVAGSPQSFVMAKGLKAVFQALSSSHAIACSWNDNYQEGNYRSTTQVLKHKANARQIPYILDPANPFNNAAARFGAWDEVAQMAQQSLQSPSLRDVYAHGSWK